MADSPEQNKLERVLHHFVDFNYKSGGSDIYMEKLLTHLSGNDDNCKQYKYSCLWRSDY
jgi:hypothetical protein